MSQRDDGRGVVLTLDWQETEGVVIALELFRLRRDASNMPEPSVAARRQRIAELEMELAAALANAEGVFR